MKKYMSIFLSIILIATLLCPGVYSLDETEYYCENAFSDTVDIDSPFVAAELSDSAKTNFYSTSVGSVDYNAASLLDDNQMKVFDAIKNSDVGIMSVTVTYSTGELLTSELTQIFLTEIMYAVCYDLPQFFYHAGYSANYGYNSAGYVTKIIYNFKLISINLSSGTVGPTYTSSTVASCWTQIKNVLNSLEFDSSNRYNFVKDVHDYLCNSIIYPDIPSDYYVGDCHDAYGALVNGYAVCQGYAEAFKLICDLYKIPCVYISGTANGGGHAWNAVQMDDGKWYLIDATWDDQDSYLFDDYFLCGLNSVDTYFGCSVFSSSHVADTAQFIPSLNYGTDYYAQTDHYTLFDATYNCDARTSDNILVLSATDVSSNNIYYNGMYVDVQSKATGTEFAVNNKSGVTENWELSVLGDPNGDGVVNVTDYSVAVNYAIGADTAADGAEMIACDACYDGYIDALDLAVIARVSSGFDKDIVIY